MPEDAAVRTCSTVWTCAQVVLVLAAIPIILPLIPLFLIGALFITPVAVPLVIAAHVLGLLKRPSARLPQRMKPVQDANASTAIGDQLSPGKSGLVHFRDPDSAEVDGTMPPKRSRQDPGVVADSLIEETLRAARLEVSQGSSPRQEGTEQGNEEEASPTKGILCDAGLVEPPGTKEEEKGKRAKAEEIFDKTFKALFSFGKEKSPAKSETKVDDSPGTPRN